MINLQSFVCRAARWRVRVTLYECIWTVFIFMTCDYGSCISKKNGQKHYFWFGSDILTTSCHSRLLNPNWKILLAMLITPLQKLLHRTFKVFPVKWCVGANKYNWSWMVFIIIDLASVTETKKIVKTLDLEGDFCSWPKKSISFSTLCWFAQY